MWALSEWGTQLARSTVVSRRSSTRSIWHSCCPVPQREAIRHQWRCEEVTGTTGYYRSYIQYFSRIARPLYDLLKVTVPSDDQSTQKSKAKVKTSPTKKSGQKLLKQKVDWNNHYQQILERIIAWFPSISTNHVPCGTSRFPQGLTAG